MKNANNICLWYKSKQINLSKKIWNIETLKNVEYDKIYSSKNSNIEYVQNKNNKIIFELKDKNITVADLKKKIIDKYEKINIKLSKETKYSNDQIKIKLKTNATKEKKELNSVNTVTKMKQFKLYFDEKQKKKIIIWINACDKVYNHVITEYNKNKSDFELNYTKQKLIVFLKLYKKNKKDCPYDILTDEVRTVCSNIKSCLTNLKKNNIQHFTINQRINWNRRSILIPSKSISKNGIFCTLLGKNNLFLLKELNSFSDSRLIYDKKTNNFYIKVPIQKKIKSVNNNNIVALDPGENIFQTFYSTNKCGFIGKKIKYKLISERKKIQHLQSKINNGNISNNKKAKKIISNKYKKIKNICADMRNKAALFLCKNFKTILIPKFKTGKMKISDNLQKNIKFVLNQMSHYKFQQHLQHKCDEYGCKLLIVTEEYTSQCCGHCGKLSKKFNKRIKTCTYCDTICHRDINGARNILLKYATKYRIS